MSIEIYSFAAKFAMNSFEFGDFVKKVEEKLKK